MAPQKNKKQQELNHLFCKDLNLAYPTLLILNISKLEVQIAGEHCSQCVGTF